MHRPIKGTAIPMMAQIQWAPKVRRDLIRRLYQNDAHGLVDDDLINAVGFALYQRCESILMVTCRAYLLYPPVL